VRSTQRMPFRTVRRPLQGRPRPSLRRGGSGMRESRMAHLEIRQVSSVEKRHKTRSR
jgi:hypothetical protein